MNEVIAKKYVKALLESLELNELNEINEALGKIDSAFGIEKFIDILILPSLNAKAKADFVFSLTDSTNEKLKNFLYTLATAKRLEILPHIYREFSYQKSLKDNAFKGAEEYIKDGDCALIDRLGLLDRDFEYVAMKYIDERGIIVSSKACNVLSV